MIEIETHFQLNKEQLGRVLIDAEFVGIVENHDIYFDFPDFRLAKKEVKLRKRNGLFELKIEKSKKVEEEIESEDEIKVYFDTALSIEEFVKETMIVLTDYKTKRTHYRKGEFNIDIDECDFGYGVIEIELMIKKENEIKNGEEKMKKFIIENRLVNVTMMGKRKTYLLKNNPELFDKIYGDS